MPASADPVSILLHAATAAADAMPAPAPRIRALCGGLSQALASIEFRRRSESRVLIALQADRRETSAGRSPILV
jgi:hypothetical protein